MHGIKSLGNIVLGGRYLRTHEFMIHTESSWGVIDSIAQYSSRKRWPNKGSGATFHGFRLSGETHRQLVLAKEALRVVWGENTGEKLEMIFEFRLTK